MGFNTKPKGHPHDSGPSHATGESVFIDDLPRVPGELLVGVITSPHAHARIKKVNVAQALKVPGVVGIYSHRDLAHNRWGTIIQDQPVLAEDSVQFEGEAILILAAEDERALALGREALKITYEVQPAILSVQKAKAARSHIGPERFIKKGNVDHALMHAPHTLKGQLEISGQDHFYLETQCALSTPDEGGNLIIESSSQHPSEVQHVVAHALGLSLHQVVVRVKRMGGGFGGKESQAAPIAAFAALVTQKTGRPARLVLTRDEDMVMTGKRNPFLIDYEVGFDGKGRLLALKAALFSNGGAYADLSTSIMERAMLHSDNAYMIPNAHITGQVCKTHQHPSTAFRGFGGPKGVAMIERIMEEVAEHVGRDPLEVRKLNCYDGGNESVTPYGQPIEGDMLPRLFAKLEKDCRYGERRKEIDAHNWGDSRHVRGLSMTAVKFGISFTTRFLNQGNALVNLHKDGSVQVSTGATEMGQGVNTRIAQVVAHAFGIGADRVRVMVTSTEKNHNTSPTAASSGTDINGSAALVAANRIKARLSELALRVVTLPKDQLARNTAGLGTADEVELDEAQVARAEQQDFLGVRFEKGRVVVGTHSVSFEELVTEAYLSRISLGDYAHYRYPGIHFDKLTGKGRPFFYYTNGVAASEVSVDRLTGDLKVLRSDLLLDLGRPINEALDLGQCTGGFIQGMGWVTTELPVYSSEGRFLTHAPSTYKIPNVQDLPREFNVDLLPNDENLGNLRGSKAVGEPPLLLGLSVWTAARNALGYLRKGVRLRIPANNEELLGKIEGWS